MNQITPFSFEGRSIRVVTDESGESQFVGKDVCESLGYADHINAMKLHCKGVAKRHPLPTAGGVQELRVLAESDVMRLIVNSTLPAAEPFERWVFEEVLPSIRKTGAYAMPESALPVAVVAQIQQVARAQIGGITKSVINKAIEDALTTALPALFHGFMSSQQTSLIHGITAGQVWDMHGLPKMKNAAAWLSRHLTTFGCQIEGEGRAMLGGRTAKLFNPEKSAKVMKSGLLEFCKKHADSRTGKQGSLFTLKPL